MNNRLCPVLSNSPVIPVRVGPDLPLNTIGYLCGYYCVGASRGFAFVEFSTLQEAMRWMEMKQVSVPRMEEIRPLAFVHYK